MCRETKKEVPKKPYRKEFGKFEFVVKNTVCLLKSFYFTRDSNKHKTMKNDDKRLHQNILEVFASEKALPHKFLRVSAPMVRYSKMEFRLFLRKYGVKLCFTPMIIADSFNNSLKARHNEFTTCYEDQPLIAQFAAKNEIEFAEAAKLIYPYVDGVDLNCGCPQSWAISQGIGCGLLRKPQLVKEIIMNIRRNLPVDFSISLKIRLLNGEEEESVRSTVELARQLEKCGATFLSIHGRTMRQRTSDPLNIEAMATVKSALTIPLIVNGNVKSWQDACKLYDQTKADGVMAARGLLSNPTLFDPTTTERDKTSMQCVQEWLDCAIRAGDNMKFQSLHHHLTFMWGNHVKRSQRQDFNNFTKKEQVFQFFEENYGLRPSPEVFTNPYKYTNCTYSHYEPQKTLRRVEQKLSINDWNENSNGKFFEEFNKDTLNTIDDLDCNLENSFFSNLS